MEREVELLITDWFRRVRESQRIHYECGTRFSRLNYALGIPTIVLTAAVGTAVFASVDVAAAGSMRIVVGLVSIVAAVLASLHTFLGFDHRADRHRAAGAGYGGIRRSLEYLKTFPPADPEEFKRAVAEIKEMDRLAESAPEVPARIKARIDQEMKGRSHRRVFDLPAEDQRSTTGEAPPVP
jgi:hypothetical protein